tara:strand:- start:116 stop:721 length:606 start_codon:yes stop_codon:yes gene_type:complete
MSSIDVQGWDFSRFGQAGYGPADIEAAENLGASPYQIGQLAEEARRRGLHIGAAGMDKINAAPTAPWNYGAVGNYGFGMKDVNAVNNLDQVKQYVSWGQQNNLPIGMGVREWVTNKETERNDARMQKQMAAWQSAYQKPKAPDFVRGDPSQVGRTGQLSRQAGRRYTAKRGLNSLKRKPQSSYSNPMGNVGTGKSLNIKPS